VPISSGQTYSLSLRFRGAVASTNALDTFLITYTNKTDCEHRVSGTTVNGLINTGATIDWTAHSSNVTAGSSARWARVWIRLGSAGIATTLFIDAVRLTPSTLTSGLDLAETFPTRQGDNLRPGELVSLGPPAAAGDAYAVRSSGAYDSRLFGVISTQPGLLLDDGRAYDKVPVALAGRVPVKVSDENGPIETGDPIAASSVPGVGMKAAQAGRIVGTAVTAFGGEGEGTIIVLINPEFWAPPVGDNLQANAVSFGSLRVSGTANLTNLNVSGRTSLAALTVTGDAKVEGELRVNSLVVTANLRLQGHLLSEGARPLAEPGTGLGVDTATLTAAVEVDGTDTAGTITLTAGENTAAGVLATVMFSRAYEATPRIVLGAVNENSLSLPVFARRIDGGFEIVTNAVAQVGQVYQFDYVIIGSSAAAL
jgi:hypothetical protein